MLARRLEEVQARVVAAAERAGRDPAQVRTMVVTKTHPRAVVDQLLAAGARLFGENRVQEATQKYGGDPGRADYELHLIGHLQRNKATAAAGLFDAVQSIDKLVTATALARGLGTPATPMRVLLELNSSGEVQKHGCRSLEELLELQQQIGGELPALRVAGVMTMAPYTEDRERIRACFRHTREAFERMRIRDATIDTLSMGMSGDFELAVEEGATLLRLGTVVLGPRPDPAAAQPS